MGGMIDSGENPTFTSAEDFLWRLLLDYLNGHGQKTIEQECNLWRVRADEVLRLLNDVKVQFSRRACDDRAAAGGVS